MTNETMSLDDLEEIFIAQYGELPCGVFLNPTIESIDGDEIIFRCFYDNYDNDEDSWHYGFNVKSRKFYQA